MDVVYCFDDNYVEPSAISALGLLRVSPSARLHLVHQGVSGEKLSWLVDKLNAVSACYSLYEIGDDCWATQKYASHLKHVTRASNLRLLLPELLPDTVDRVLYLDGDALALVDMTEYVLSAPLSPSGFSAKKGGSLASKEWNRGLVDRRCPSLNAGVLIMDLNMLRSLNFCDCARKILDVSGGCNDQTLINVWCRGCFNRLPLELNMPPQNCSRESVPKILHFQGGSSKPWNNSNDHFAHFWHEYANAVLQ